MKKADSRALLAYQGTVLAVSAFLLVFLLREFPVSDWYVVIVLGLLTFLAEWFAVTLPLSGTGSVGFAVIFAAVLLGGPTTGALVAMTAGVSRQDIADRKPLMTVLFNTAQLALTGALAGLAMEWLGQPPLYQSAAERSLDWFLAACAAAAVIAFANMALVGTGIAIKLGVPVGRVWREAFLTHTLSLVVLGLLGLVLAELVVVAGLPGVLLLAVPFAVAQQTFRVYEDLSTAYLETVRSLIAAVEAKDPYTRGHSERVAWYARAVAEQLELKPEDLRTLEWAALLHDVGKVAYDAAVLGKPGRLTPEEYASIQEHPVIAVSIVREIDFLRDAEPLIASHHERLDGRGYPAGLAEHQIPLGARILAVADAFDAMTSTRPYRQALSYEDAVTELKACAGTQLDRECVDALIERVDESTLTRLLQQAHASVGESTATASQEVAYEA